MKIKVVSYSKTYQLPFASFYEKIFVQADLDEGEDARKALYECKKTVESFHFESNKAAEKVKEFTLVNSEGVGTLEDHINSCTEMKVLESYRLMVKGVPSLQKIYDKKFEELK